MTLAISTYITSTEASNMYPNDSGFSAQQRSDALAASFGLVNTYIASTLVVPVMSEWDGESTITAPWVLKICQGQFYRWYLEKTLVDFDDDLRELYEATEKILQGISQDNLAVPSQKFAHDAGWHVVNMSSGVQGRIDIEGAPPEFTWYYTLEITTGGFPGTIVFQFTRSDSETPTTGLRGYSTQWTAVDSRFNVRFDGEWDNGDQVMVVGVPSEKINAVANPKKSGIQQGPVSYAGARAAHV